MSFLEETKGGGLVVSTSIDREKGRQVGSAAKVPWRIWGEGMGVVGWWIWRRVGFVQLTDKLSLGEGR